MLRWRVGNAMFNGSSLISQSDLTNKFYFELTLLAQIKLDESRVFSNEMAVKLEEALDKIFHPYMKKHLAELVGIIMPMLTESDKKVILFTYLFAQTYLIFY